MRLDDGFDGAINARSSMSASTDGAVTARAQDTRWGYRVIDVNVGIGAGDGAVLVPAVETVVGEGGRDAARGLGVRALLASMEAAAVWLAVTIAEKIVGGGEHGYFFCLRFVTAYPPAHCFHHFSINCVLCCECLICCNCSS